MSYLNSLKYENNITTTENGALTYKSTFNGCLDFFALAGSMRNRSEIDIIQLFMSAYVEDKLTALKLLFYMRDIRNGQGERRLFRTIIKDLATFDSSTVLTNLENIAEFGRWDDLLCLMETPCELFMLDYIKKQFEKDLNSETPSLLGKWLPSENASSKETKKIATKIRKYLELSAKEYRKSLSALRRKINIVETLIVQRRYDEIEYDKLPSKAGLKYRQAFLSNDYERYSSFMSKDNKEVTKVNAKTLYPYEIVHNVLEFIHDYNIKLTKEEINVYDKYWNNLKDYFNGKQLNNICVVDTSGSMYGRPMEVAFSLGLYTAERAGGPFKNHFITFSTSPQLVEIKGDNIYKKIRNISKADWGMNTNIKAVFDLLLKTALKHNCSQEEIPENIIIISDMEFDSCTTHNNIDILFKIIKKEWDKNGYEMPHLIFWNVDARQNNIPVLGRKISYVSGFSPSIFEAVLSNKSGFELMMEVVNNPRYDCIKLPVELEVK